MEGAAAAAAARTESSRRGRGGRGRAGRMRRRGPSCQRAARQTRRAAGAAAPSRAAPASQRRRWQRRRLRRRRRRRCRRRQSASRARRRSRRHRNCRPHVAPTAPTTTPTSDHRGLHSRSPNAVCVTVGATQSSLAVPRRARRWRADRRGARRAKCRRLGGERRLRCGEGGGGAVEERKPGAGRLRSATYCSWSSNANAAPPTMPSADRAGGARPGRAAAYSTSNRFESECAPTA